MSESDERELQEAFDAIREDVQEKIHRGYNAFKMAGYISTRYRGSDYLQHVAWETYKRRISAVRYP